MNSGKYVFTQLIEFLPQKTFQRIVMRYQGDKYIKSFGCWNQLLVMMFGQLSGCESLRKIACIATAHVSKTYHLGFGRSIITRSNFAKANANRDSKIFEEFAYKMISIARSKRITREFEIAGQLTAKKYPSPIRRIVYYSKEHRRSFTYLTNSLTTRAEHIALLYKNRWQVELFFKWIKQHLHVKSFWGVTENAVRIRELFERTELADNMLNEDRLKLSFNF